MVEPDTRQRLRVDDQTVTAVLDRLDGQARPPSGIDLRVAERFTCRAHSLPLDLAPAREPARRVVVASRNLSSTGMGILAGQFVYPGTRSTVTLTSLHGREQTVPGRVTRCRYLVDSGMLYDVGLKFDRPIDVALFAEHARLLRILLLHDSPAAHELVAGFLESRHVDLTCVTAALDAATAALSLDFDLILLDLECPDFDAFMVTKELRQAGYLGPMVGMAVQTGRRLHAKCTEAGCTGYLAKPVTRDALHALVDSLMDEPVLSSLADEVTLAPLINRFVASLPDLARRLSAAFEAGDTGTVHSMARALRADAGSFGFDVITEEAEHVQALAALGMPPDRLRPALYDLIHLCLAARLVSGGGESAEA